MKGKNESVGRRGNHIEEKKMNRCRSMRVRRLDTKRKDLHELWNRLRPEGKR